MKYTQIDLSNHVHVYAFKRSIYKTHTKSKQLAKMFENQFQEITRAVQTLNDPDVMKREHKKIDIL